MNMKRAILVLIVGAFIALVAVAKPVTHAPVVAGCGWWNSGGGAVVVSQIEQEGGCLLAQVESGNTDPVSVAIACTGSLLGNFVKDVEAILAFYTQPPAPAADGGAAFADKEARCGRGSRAAVQGCAHMAERRNARQPARDARSGKGGPRGGSEVVSWAASSHATTVAHFTLAAASPRRSRTSSSCTIPSTA